MSLRNSAIARLSGARRKVLRKNAWKNAARFSYSGPQVESLEPRVLLSASGLASESLGGAAPLFAENAGQWDNADIHFGYNAGGSQLFFTDDSIDFTLAQWQPDSSGENYDVLSTEFALQFDGATAVAPMGVDEADTYFNYHVGDQSQWVDGVDTFGAVVYEDLYAGIDLHAFSRQGEIKYEFHIAPGGDASQIELTYAGVEGLSLGADGELRIATELGEIVDEGLYIYQEIEGQRVQVAGEFELIDADSYTFRITGDYDAAYGLVIDPTVVWGSYLGKGLEDGAQGVAVDSANNVYTAGYTASSSWISGGADVTFGGDVDGFLVKLNSAGAHVWSTYFGGLNDDRANAVTIDKVGNIYVAGQTMSGGWVSGGADVTFGGTVDAFLVKLSAAGVHLWSTYMGTNSHDAAHGVAVDSTNSVYVVGRTDSLGWVSGGYDTALTGGRDGFLVKFNAAGVHQWSTFIGGDAFDYATSVVADSADRIYVAGQTQSFFWAVGGNDTTFQGGSDGFLIRLTAAGGFVWSTYVGGNANETAHALAVDSANRVYVVGETNSLGWVSGGYDTTLSGSSDGFVTKITGLGVHLWSTYVGGNVSESANAIAIDLGTNNVYVGGRTDSGGWVAGGFDTTYGSVQDGFIVRLASTTGASVWSSYVGGSLQDTVTGLAMGASMRVHAAGQTYSGSWLSGGYDTTYAGLGDGFVLKINDSVASSPLATARDIGALPVGVPQTLTGGVNGVTDRSDYVKFTVGRYTKLTATLTRMTRQVKLQLLDSAGTVLKTSARSGRQTQKITRYLSAGTYYLRAYRLSPGATNYRMRILGAADRDYYNQATALDLGAIAARRLINGAIGATTNNLDRNDWYKFTIAGPAQITATLSRLTRNANLQLTNAAGVVLKTSRRGGRRNERIVYNALAAGTYYLRVYYGGLGRTAYTLGVQAL